MAQRLLAALFLACALPALGGELTWQDANHRSAELIRDGGNLGKAADLARAAFDLYASQSPHYTPENHAQLLLNAVDAREKASGIAEAMKELDRGTAALAAKNGGEPPVLVELWEQGANLAGRDGRDKAADDYYARATALAEKRWGADDPRAIALHVRWASALGQHNGRGWTLAKLHAARERAARTPAAATLLGPIDLALAKIDVESGKDSAAVTEYRTAIRRLEASADPADRLTLQAAYAQLGYACEQAGYRECAEDARRKLAGALGPEGEALMPLLRVAPAYPRLAVRGHHEGSVTMLLTVGPDGSVTQATVAQSQPPGVFDDAALKAVRQWKFKPKVVDGKPVETHGLQTIEFRMAAH